jgi:hypothetical protein
MMAKPWTGQQANRTRVPGMAGDKMRQRTDVLEIPRFVLEVDRSETELQSAADLVDHFRREIEAHPYARLVGIFDHYAHTRSLPDGEIAPEIIDAKNVVFCFGMCLPEPSALATRPRSIGIAELQDRFVISFLETPMPLANSALEAWARGVVRGKEPVIGQSTNPVSEETRPMENEQ